MCTSCKEARTGFAAQYLQPARSKCPDARACLQKLVMPTMANISDKVDFRLSFIGQYVLTSTTCYCTLTHPDSPTKTTASNASTAKPNASAT